MPELDLDDLFPPGFVTPEAEQNAARSERTFTWDDEDTDAPLLDEPHA